MIAMNKCGFEDFYVSANNKQAFYAANAVATCIPMTPHQVVTMKTATNADKSSGFRYRDA